MDSQVLKSLLRIIFKRTKHLSGKDEPMALSEQGYPTNLEVYFDSGDGFAKISKPHSLLVWQFVRQRESYKILYQKYSQLNQSEGANSKSQIEEILREFRDCFYLGAPVDPSVDAPAELQFCARLVLENNESNSIRIPAGFGAIRTEGIKQSLAEDALAYLLGRSKREKRPPSQHRNIMSLTKYVFAWYSQNSDPSVTRSQFSAILVQSVFIGANIKELKHDDSHYDHGCEMFEQISSYSPEIFFR